MIDFDKELATILEIDPLGLLEIKTKASSVMSADERLFASFEEINAFMREQGREPAASREISERKLYSRLKALRAYPEKAALLFEMDVFNLLGGQKMPAPKKIETIDDVLEDDALGLLGDEGRDESDADDIFTLRNIPKSTDTPEYIANRKPCENFAQFEVLFKQNQAALLSKKKRTKPFKSVEQIKKGKVFILQGMLVYVANVGQWEKKNFGNRDRRLYCIFENGTESNMLLRSLASALWKDENSAELVEADQMEMYQESEQITEEDKTTGIIYVLRSLSTDPRIKSIKDLYKIGFSRQSLEERIQNAEKEPTYLMAEVKRVTAFQTYNLNPQKLELLLHTFFAEACLNLDIFDGEGKRHTPREWFIVPLHVIETAVRLLVSGEIPDYRYNSQKQEIAGK